MIEIIYSTSNAYISVIYIYFTTFGEVSNTTDRHNEKQCMYKEEPKSVSVCGVSVSVNVCVWKKE